LLFLLLFFYLLTKIKENGAASRFWMPFLCGLSVGMAFAARYVLILLLLVGVVFLVIEKLWKSGRLVFFLSGAILTSAPVLIRNYMIMGCLLPKLKPADENLANNLWDLIKAVWGTFLPDSLLSEKIQIIIGVTIGAIFVFLLISKYKKESLNVLFINEGRYIYWLWAGFYFTGLFVQRSYSHFDMIDSRFIFMGTLPLVFLCTGIALGFIRKNSMLINTLPVMLVLVIFGREIWTASVLPFTDRSTKIENSATLTWIRDNTTSRDLIIGDNSVYVPFYFDYPEAVSYSPYPYTYYFTETNVKEITETHCSTNNHIYLIIRVSQADKEERWKSRYGEFITSLVFHREDPVQSVRFIKDTGESVIYSVKCP